MTPAINIPSALLTVYLGITAFTTVRPVAASRWLNVSGMLMAGAVGLTCVALAFEAIAIGGAGAGIAYPLFLFAAVALLASAGDLRMLTEFTALLD